VPRAFLLGLRRQLVLETQRRHEQVDVDAEQPLGRLAAHGVGDEGAHVAPLGDVARVAEAPHQLRPRACDAAGVPAELGRLAREAVARQGRQHQVECVLGVAAVSGRVGQRSNGLEQLDDRAGPAVGHDQRQRILVR
jgi:signal transduction histidine kinase